MEPWPAATSSRRKFSQRLSSALSSPPVAGLQKDGLKYRGFLYFGLMLTAEGPKVIEYNCRFGDPECEAVLPLFGGDFAAYVIAAASGRLQPELLEFKDGWSVCIILASAGYPATTRSGDVIRGLEAVEEARVYHCGTKQNDANEFETNEAVFWLWSLRPPREPKHATKPMRPQPSSTLTACSAARILAVMHFD